VPTREPSASILSIAYSGDGADLDYISARGWKAFEAPGVEPVFPTKDDAISYAQARARFRAGEIRVLDSSGNVERTIAFNGVGANACTSLLQIRCTYSPSSG
jgi:hypothetical protein